MKSLKSQQVHLADSKNQIDIIQHGQSGEIVLYPFEKKLKESGIFPLKPVTVEIFQINLGKMCNQVCKHCHVDAGPDRKEIMTRQTMQQCLDIIKENNSIKTVDLTGGAPELNPDFRWFIEQLSHLKRHIIVRCNLTIILANKKFNDLPEFYKQHKIEIISSLPFYTADRTDRQRGEGVFQKSITALRMLNDTGYGKNDPELKLNLVYNPAGAFLPPSQSALEIEYKESLKKQYGIDFHNLFVITNMPISRYLDFLLASGNYENYMEKLVNAYNPVAAANVMCRNTISVGWDGYIYDCDFNQMLELKVNCSSSHIKNFNTTDLLNREIITGQHCYGCTAGSGSSCGGTVA